MLLIAEIILTVFVWRKGWKWASLIPIVMAVLIGFMIGLTGGDLAYTPGIILIDVVAVIALIVMLYNGPKKTDELPK